MVNVGFELNGDAQAGQLTLSGPLGMLGAQAHWGQGKAWLITASGRTNYDSLDALIAAALGEAIPVAALFDWLRGRPWRGADHVMSADGRNGFEQLGWRIDLSRWTTGHLQAQRQVPPIVTLRVVMERD